MFPPSMSRSELYSNNSLPDLAHTLEEHLLAGFPPDLALDLVLNELVVQVADATQAGGAALALPRGDAMVCRATTGQLAPGLGVTLDGTHGLSGACLQTGLAQISLDTEVDPRVDHEASRRLGIRSIFIVPVLRRHHEDEDTAGSPNHSSGRDDDSHERNPDVVGILEVFAATPNAFPESAQSLLQRFAEECARIRIVATELSWHKPAGGLASDDFMPPPLPHSGYMWPDFAAPEAANLDSEMFAHSDRVEEYATEEGKPYESPASILPDALLPDALLADSRLADDAPDSDHQGVRAVTDGRSPEFARHLPATSKYEGWTVAIGALAILAIIAVSFLIGSRVGWLTAPLSPSAAVARSVPGTGREGCLGSNDPNCDSPPTSSHAQIAGARSGDKSAKVAKNSDHARAKSADTPAENGDLVVYEKGKVVFRMKPGQTGTETAALSHGTNGDGGAQNVARPTDTSPVVDASSSTRIPLSKSVRLSPQEAESRLLSRVEPKFPPEAVASRRAGTVVLEVQVAEDGTIANLRVLSGDPVLASAASEAVRNWRYQPYRQGNQPSQFQTDVTLNFTPSK